ncbi:MAG: hypothetical protein H6912_09390 [Kordiimonadaceae bacterium]|nr:hypothetical protein [Kordiimonadaceae bacterium]
MFNPRQYILDQTDLLKKNQLVKSNSAIKNKQKIQIRQNRFRNTSENGHIKLVKITSKSMVDYCIPTNYFKSCFMFTTLPNKRVKVMRAQRAARITFLFF